MAPVILHCAQATPAIRDSSYSSEVNDPMKKIRILTLSSIMVLSFATGVLAQAEESRTDSDQAATAQSEEKAAPPTEQQTITESEQQATPAPETTADAE
jgi:hypothetical protein